MKIEYVCTQLNLIISRFTNISEIHTVEFFILFPEMNAFITRISPYVYLFLNVFQHT
jgi:hypothetical protein